MQYISTHKSQSNKLIIALLIITALFLIIPIPAVILDSLIYLSLLFSIITTLTLTLKVIKTFKTLKISTFSIFPIFLLFTTFFKHTLNVSSTRLILNQGINFDVKIVRAFGNLVVNSPADILKIIIGIIIFIMFVFIQFVLIVRCSTRALETAVRFCSLDNQFMSIKMDINNGYTTEEEALQRIKNLMNKAHFFKNMDIACKFIEIDVIMGILLTMVNIIGGLCLGLFCRHEELSIAIQNYLSVAIGIGLINLIQSLLISIAIHLYYYTLKEYNILD